MSPAMLNYIAEARRISQALKPSRKWQPMKQTSQRTLKADTGQAGEVWENHLYTANVWRQPGSTVIGICSIDGEARHDWRDFQRIKNDIVGAEWEAVELYPAESRLIDTSNYFYLFARPAFPDIGKQIGRQILHASHSLAPQRPWHTSEEPKQVLADRPTLRKET